MRRLIATHALFAAALLSSSCSGPATAPEPASQNAAASRATPQAPPPSVVSSHGDGAAPALSGNAAAPPSGANVNANTNSNANAGEQAERKLVNTAALDEKISKALARAKRPNASAAERREAAGAYLERGNVYYSAGNPRLYKYALADFNSALLYEPSGAEAKAKRDEILRIYRDMGRPVPQVSNEQ